MRESWFFGGKSSNKVQKYVKKLQKVAKRLKKLHKKIQDSRRWPWGNLVDFFVVGGYKFLGNWMR